MPAPSDDWRSDLRNYAMSYRAALLRPGWLIQLIGSRQGTGPNTRF